MNKRILTLVMGLAAVLGLSACGRHCGDRVEHYSGKITKRLASKLKLDETQKAKLEAVRTTIVDKHKEMKAGRADKLADVLALIRAEKFDKAKAESLGDAHRKSMDGVKGKLLDQIAEFHASLKPEQREELAKLVEKKASCYLEKD